MEAWEIESSEIQSSQQLSIRGLGRTHIVIIVQTKGRVIVKICIQANTKRSQWYNTM